MRYPAILAAVLVAGCVPEYDLGPPPAELRSDPSVLVLASGESQEVTLEAFVNNEPETVRWSIGQTGAGITVVEDSSYGSVFVEERLTLPPRSHSRRYVVTMTDTVATSFVIAGGTAVVTIPVIPGE